MYIHAEGDEGDFVAINTDPKVLSDLPHASRFKESHCVRPTSGTLLCFPSGLIHMVEPNVTDRERYSVAFNMNSKWLTDEFMFNPKVDDDSDAKIRGWNLFDVEGGYLKR